MVSGKFLKTVR